MIDLVALIRPRPPAARITGLIVAIVASLGLFVSLIGITTATVAGEPAALGFLPTAITWAVVAVMYAFCFGIRPPVRSTKYGATLSPGWKTGVGAGFTAVLSPIFSAFVVGALSADPRVTGDVVMSTTVATLWTVLSIALPVVFVVRPFLAVGESAITYSRGFFTPTQVPYQDLKGVHWVVGGRRRSPYFVLETATPRPPVVGQNFGEELSPRVGANRAPAERDQILAVIEERIAKARTETQLTELS